MDGWMDRWRWMDGWMDGWMDRGAISMMVVNVE